MEWYIEFGSVLRILKIKFRANFICRNIVESNEDSVMELINELWNLFIVIKDFE